VTTLERPVPYTVAGGRLLAGAAFALPPLVLLAVALGLAFRGGGVVADQWQPVALGTTASLLVLAAVGALPSAPRRGWVVLAFWATLLVWTTASLLWSLSREATFEAATRIAMLAGVVTIGAAYASRARAALALAAGIAVSGSLVAVLIEWKLLSGSIGIFAGERLVWPVSYANADAALLWISVPALVTFAAAHPLRPLARGAFGLLATLVLALGLAAQSRGAVIAIVLALVACVAIARDRGRLALTLFAVLIPVVVAAIRIVDGNTGSATEARELGLAVGLAALLGGLLVGSLALLDRRDRFPFGGREARAAAVVGALFAVAALAAFVAINGRPDDWMADRWNEFTTTGESTSIAPSFGTGTSTRYEYWRVALDAGVDRPLAGVGAGAFSVPWFRERTLNESVTDAHSWEAGAFAELGLVGLVLTAGALLVPLAGLRLARRAEGAWPIAAVALGGVVVYFVIHASLEWLLRIPPVAIPALLALGALAGAGATTGLRLAGRRARLIVAGAALAATLLVLPAYVSTAALSRAENAAATDTDRALESLDTATRFNPFSVQPLIQRATILHLAGDEEAARRAADRAVERGPNDWAGWMVATETRYFVGDADGARAARRKALELNPRSQPFPSR
jgi:O-Antigen ligase